MLNVMLINIYLILYVKIATLFSLINVLFFWLVGLGVQPLLMETKTETTSNTESHSEDEEG